MSVKNQIRGARVPKKNTGNRGKRRGGGVGNTIKKHGVQNRGRIAGAFGSGAGGGGGGGGGKKKKKGPPEIFRAGEGVGGGGGGKPVCRERFPRKARERRNWFSRSGHRALSSIWPFEGMRCYPVLGMGPAKAKPLPPRGPPREKKGGKIFNEMFIWVSWGFFFFGGLTVKKTNAQTKNKKKNKKKKKTFFSFLGIGRKGGTSPGGAGSFTFLEIFVNLRRVRVTVSGNFPAFCGGGRGTGSSGKGRPEKIPTIPGPKSPQAAHFPRGRSRGGRRGGPLIPSGFTRGKKQQAFTRPMFFFPRLQRAGPACSTRAVIPFQKQAGKFLEGEKKPTNRGGGGGGGGGGRGGGAAVGGGRRLDLRHRRP